MRRYFNNGTTLVDIIKKGTTKAAEFMPGGGAASIIKKMIKNKKDKDSRNPDPKTPKMMGEDKKEKTSKRKEDSDTSKFLLI